MCSFLHPEVGLRAHVVEAAESLVEKARYCFLSEQCKPPGTVNCGMLVRWVFEERGFRCLPAIGPQLLAGIKKMGRSVDQPRPGDLVFVHQPRRTYEHVGIIAFDGRVIHACWLRKVVTADPIADFCRDSRIEPCYRSLCDDSAGLTPYDIGRYLREEFPSSVLAIIERHAGSCDTCDAHIELTRRYRAPQPCEELQY